MSKQSARKAFDNFIKILENEAQANRKERLDGLKDKKDVKAWSTELLEWYRAKVGPIVKLKGKMKTEQCGTIPMDGYTIEKWRFESLPGTMTSALLYMPQKYTGGTPIICAPIGHWTTGKEEPDYQKMGGYMAYNGIPVLVYEHAGLGERREYSDPVTGLNMLGNSPTDEHNHTGVLATLLGQMPLRTFVSEAVHARDFLASFDWADRALIGYTGSSGGGTLSRYAAAYEGDAFFCIPICIIGGEGIGGSSDAEQALWSCGVRGVAAVDLLAAIGPSPVQIIRETGFDQVAKSYATLRKVYDILKAPEEMTHLLPIDDKHGYTAPMTAAVYHFLAGNFGLPAADPDTWGHVRLLKEEDTWTGPTGRLMNDIKQVTLQDHLTKQVSKAKGFHKEGLTKMLKIHELDRSPVPYEFKGVPAGEITVCGFEEMAKNSLGLLDWEEHATDWYHRRGIVGKSNMAGAARHLLCYDLNLMGVWVQQILDFCADNNGLELSLSASGSWALPVVCAAALVEDSDIASHTFKVTRLLGSYKHCFKDRLSCVPVQQVIPSFIQYGDIYDLVKMAGDKLEVLSRVDAQGRVVSEGE